MSFSERVCSKRVEEWQQRLNSYASTTPLYARCHATDALLMPELILSVADTRHNVSKGTVGAVTIPTVVVGLVAEAV